MITSSQIAKQIEYAAKKGWLEYYKEASAFYNIPIEILLGKDSRESSLGTYPGLQNNGWYGSDGISKGISQINTKENRFALITDGNDVRAFVAVGASMLQDEYKRFGNWKDALSAYNTGAGNVSAAIKKGIDPDQYTTGKDYAKDVLYRAELIKRLSQNDEIPVSINAAKVDGTIILGITALATLYYIARRLDFV